jgi:hypothetical protein
VKRKFLALVVVLAAAAASWADPPKVPQEPVKVKVGESHQLVLKYAGKDKLLSIPGFDTKDCTFFRGHSDEDGVVQYLVIPRKPGTYRMSFLVVGDSTYSTVVIDADGDPCEPKVVPPPKNPPDGPAVPAGRYYFMIVKADGPTPPWVTDALDDPAWETLEEMGHRVKPKTLAQAKELGMQQSDLNGLDLPVVVTLQVSSDGKTSKVVRKAVALPKTAADILKLPEGVK